MARHCEAINEGGQPCGATRQRERPYCFWHDPDNRAEAQDARRLGGLRRRREATLAGAYDFDGLATVADIRRLLEIAVTDTLVLSNSVPRNRTIAALAQTALRLVEVSALETRLAALETAVEPRPVAATRRR